GSHGGLLRRGTRSPSSRALTGGVPRQLAQVRRFLLEHFSVAFIRAHPLGPARGWLLVEVRPPPSLLSSVTLGRGAVHGRGGRARASPARLAASLCRWRDLSRRAPRACRRPPPRGAR